MSYAVDWVARRITIPQADLTFVSAGRYRLDTDTFRKEVRRLEWVFSEGAWAAQILEYTAATLLSGTLFAPVLEVINSYEIEFEEFASSYLVEIDGANTNVADVIVLNNVSISTKNSGGLVGSPKIDEIHGRLGLDADAPLVTSSVAIVFGGVTMTLAEDINGDVTVQRT